MNGVISTFYRYAPIWSCMDAMSTIVKALDKAHHAWKLRGMQSRPLLALLMKFDHGRYLNEASRHRIAADVAAFTLVCSKFWMGDTGVVNLSSVYRRSNQM